MGGVGDVGDVVVGVDAIRLHHADARFWQFLLP